MHQNKDYNILLKKLISGTITDAERWSLEKASLDDPFLAEAIEGIYDNNADVAVPMTIEKPVALRTINWYKRMAFAASFVLLLGLSYVVIQNIESGDTDLAMKTETSQPKVGETVSNDEAEFQEHASADLIADRMEPQPIQNKAKSQVQKNSKPATQTYAESNSQESEAISALIQEESNIMPISEADEEIIAPMSDDMASMAAQAKAPQRASRKVEIERVPMMAPQQIEGHVYDQEGIPISLAVVTSEHAMDTAITDANGFFSIAVAEQDQSIMAKSEGFSPVVMPAQPEVAFRLKKAQSSFSEESLLLVEMMTANQLQREYKKILDKEINRPFSMCPNEKKNTSIQMRLFISEIGELTNLSFVDEVPFECQSSIESKIRLMAIEGQFKGTKAVSFYYKLK